MLGSMIQLDISVI